MPIPKPTKNQDKEKFLSNCMSDDVMRREFKYQSQRYAFCQSQWKKAKDKKNAKGSSEEPKWEDQSSDAITLIL